MKASEFIQLQEDTPFWGIDGAGSEEVMVKRYDGIYSLGWDVPSDPDKVVFIEYVKPVGWKPPSAEAIAVSEQHIKDIESVILIGRGGE